MQISKKRELPRKCELKYCEGWARLSDLRSSLGQSVWQEPGMELTGTNRESRVRVCVCAHACACAGERMAPEGRRTVSSWRAQARQEMHTDFRPTRGGPPSCPPCRYPVLLHQQPAGLALWGNP